MSLFSYPFGRENLIVKQLATSAEATLYTAGANGAAIVSLSVNEIAGTSSTGVSLTIYNSSTTVVARRSVTRTLTARENWQAITLDGCPIVLLPNYVLKVTASVGGTIDIDGVAIEPAQRD